MNALATYMHATYEVARKDVLQHLRTKRVLIIGLLLFLSMQVITIILPVVVFNAAGEAPDPGQAPNEHFALYFYLNASVVGGFFFIQLLAIVITADAVCSEWSGRTIFLLLSKPVPRTAFVLGKFIGSAVTVLGTIILVFCLQYVILQFVYPGGPNGEFVGRFFAALGLFCLGALAVTSVALFFSSLTRSNVTSLVLTLVAIFVVFPLIGNIGDFIYYADEIDSFRGESQPDIEDMKYDWSHYLSPERTLIGAGQVLVDEEESFGTTFLFPQLPPQRIALSVVSGCFFVAAFVLASMGLVKRRNFE